MVMYRVFPRDQEEPLDVAATATVIASGTGDVQGIAAADNLRLVGYSITEDAGTPAAAELSLRHGVLATDPELFGITLTADQSVREGLWKDGVGVPNGVFVDRISGTTKLPLFSKIVR